MVKFKDYYDTLGVSRSATEKDIKTSYRKLARQYHPDVNKGNKQSEEKFKEVTEAYEVLKDPEKRKRYDQLGANYKNGADFRPPPGQGFNFDFGNMGGMGGMGGGGGSFSDFFEMLFGQQFAGQSSAGFPGGFKQPGAAPKRKVDQEAEIELSIEELAQGTTRTLQISGGGQKARTLEVKIPAGVRAGSKVRVASGDGTGDLYLRVKVKPHQNYTIDGDNLVTEVNLTPAEAVIGTETMVTTLDGPVKIRVPQATQNGRMLRLREKGLPKLKGGTRGDQLVRVKITIPSDITEEEKALYEQLKKIEAERSASK